MAYLFTWIVVLLCSAIILARSNDSPEPSYGYKILIDAGSTGSRVYIYKYDRSSPWNTVNELSHKRLQPALSSFVDDFDGLQKQLNIFIRFAKYYVDEKDWGTSDIALKATAGLRSVSVENQDWLIGKVRQVFQTSGFRSNPLDTRVISGKEEALYGLLAVNAAFINTHDLLSIGAADLGGSSTQISFAIPASSNLNRNDNYFIDSGNVHALSNACPIDFELSLLSTYSSSGNSSISPHHDAGQLSGTTSRLFSRSIAGLGLISAMEDVIDTQLNLLGGELDTAHDQDVDPSQDFTLSPDDAVALDGEEEEEELGVDEYTAESDRNRVSSNIIYSSNDTGNVSVSGMLSNPCIAPGAPFPYLLGGKDIDLHGSGSFADCLVLVEELLLRHAQKEAQCMQQVRPRLIIGMDNLPKVLEIMHLSQEAHVAPRDIRLAGEKLCTRSWPEILHEFPTFMPYRAQRACFGATYVYALLTRVYHLQEDDRTTFLPLEVHQEYTLGWPLGAAIFSALGLDASHLVDLNPDQGGSDEEREVESEGVQNEVRPADVGDEL